jgi:hypothetical protein
MKMHGIMLFSLAIAGLTALPLLAKAQSLVDASASSSPAALPTNAALPDLTYTRPTQKMKIRNYAFDAFGPYPIVGAAFAAGINQLQNTPPEWNQGAEGYGKRFGSDFAIAAVTTTTRCTTAASAKACFRGCAMP